MLGRQWETRLRLWKENLEKRYVRPVQELNMEYFSTMEQLPLKEAENKEFSQAPVGTVWGEKWEYGWFHTSFSIPRVLSGKRVVMHLATAPEMLVYVDGRESGSIDKQHKYITIDRCATAGKVYEVYAECYAGHGLRREDAGPVGIEEITVPENPGLQVTTGKSYLALWEEDIFQAGMDYTALYELAKCLPETSLRRMKILEGLKKFTYIADFELPYEEMVQSIVKAREVLQPLLSCHNGSTAPEFTIFGQSHIDLAWLWHEDETKRKAARTYSNQLALMEEYPDFIFLMCAPTVLEYIKKYNPNLYVRVKEAAAQGRFIPEGGMWIECDTNIPSGESLIRQFARGKKWFQEEMNADSRLAWMPDTFGYSGVLPQIMKKCGIEYFATQKLLRADPECEQFPYNIFWWEGIDGTRILTHIYKKNNSQFTPAHLLERWEKDRNQEENIDSMIFPFGFGDGGGGCTRTMLEQAARCRDLEGAPRCTMESPIRFFERIDKDSVINEYVGELYLAWHRGTLTSQSETKRGIRQAEVAIHNLEYFLARAVWEGKDFPRTYQDTLESLWDQLLFCQFHDIAPGTSIERVHQDAVEMLQSVINEANALTGELMGLWAGEALCVWNPTGLPKKYKDILVPAFGQVTVGTVESGQQGKVSVTESEGGFEIANRKFTCRIDRQGRVVSFIPHAAKYEFVAKPWNEFLMFKDVNVDYDAWEIGAMYENLPVDLAEDAVISVKLTDEECILHVERTLHNSLLSQDIVIGAYADRIDFRTKIDWKERHKLLKVSFAGAVYAKEAYHDIQFGYIKRPTHRSKQSDRDRYEVSNQKYTAITDGSYGVAVLNDGKYGVNVTGSDIRLTLLRAPLVPDMHADRGVHEFTYSVYPFVGALAQSEILQEAYDVNHPPLLSRGCGQDSFCAVDQSNIVIEAVYPAEKERALVLRVYEAMGQTAAARMTLPKGARQAWETNMLLQGEQPLQIEEGNVELNFTPFEIKTILVK